MMEKEALQAMAALLGHTIKESGALKAILDDAKAGKLTEAEAMQKLMALVKATPGLEQKLMGHAQRDLAILRNTPVSPIITQQGVGNPNVPFYSRPGGLPKINPLYTGAIVERLQFDNDIPELRTGPKEIGVPPAIGITTDARNPVAIGRMMKQAEEEVGARVDALEMDRRQRIEAVAEGKSTELALIEEHALLAAKHGADAAKEMMLYGSADTDHPDYRRGAIPLPVNISAPAGAELLQTQQAAAQDAAWKMLSSTQGRRTALNAVRATIVQHLASQGIRVRWRDFDVNTPRDNIRAAHQWKVNISGARNLQEGFSTIDTAGKALGIELARQMAGQAVPSDLTLEVTPVNQISDRDVGWAARLVSTLKPKELGHVT